ncbi:MAG TPA: PIG-L family deacetylase [Candidatus Dormibacteraeota bacterium]
MAHPDDIEFFCAGSVLMLTRREVHVDFVLATSGDKGTEDADVEGPALAARREEEQLRSARLLGADDVEFLRHADAELVESLELRGEFVRAIRRSRPDLLLTFDPTPGYRQHPDHRVVGRMALDAAWPCARDRLTYPDLGPPHKTAEAWLFAGPNPTLKVDVSSVLTEKINARLEHDTQTGSPAALRARWRHIGAEERFVQVDLR